LDQSLSYLVSHSDTFVGIGKRTAFWGTSFQPKQGTGFVGHLREFYLYAGVLKPEAITAMMHNVKIFEPKLLAYYNLDIDQGILSDLYRNQKASIVEITGSQKVPTLFVNQGSRKICNQMD
jgi:hypothetical protein